MMPKQIFFDKIGFLIGFAIAALLNFYDIFSTAPQRRADTFLSTFGLFMILGEIVGGAVSGFIVEKYLRARLSKGGNIWGGIIGAVLISPVALEDGVAFGTMSAVGYGELLGRLIGMRQVGIYGVLCVGIILVIIIAEFISAVIGAFLGSLAENLFKSIFARTEK